jgi:predicted RNA-binding protein (virulence factor B family)
MLQLGQFNLLVVTDTRANGVLLDGGQSRQVFMPLMPGDASYTPGEQVEVFVYLDSDGGLAATTTKPLVEMGQVAWLEVVEANQTGAFVDWGLPKDLFIPFAEQQTVLRKGQRALVKVYLDNQNRIAGTTRIDHWIEDDASGLKVGEKVSLVIADKTEMGFKAVINHHCWGLLYNNELFQRITKGQVIDAYVKLIRADNKVDLTLSKPGFSKGKIDDISQRIIDELQAHNGHMSLTDKSPPEEIYKTFGVSKKVFKQALGALYKQRRVSLASDGVRLSEP